jgi:uncharacterized protein GlcG (DUF336 family)
MKKLMLEDANKILAAALAAARLAGNRPMAVVVVDEAGVVKAAQREDGATMFRFDIALGKAWAAAAMGVSSRILMERAAGNPNFFGALASTADGRFIPQSGAVPIVDVGGAVIGAVGASGGTGDEDESICISGLRDAGFLPHTENLS